MIYKLGRTKPTRAKLKLHRYLGPKLPPPPPSVDWTLAVSTEFGMMKNDSLGDCTCAAMGHAVQTITANGDGLVTPPDEAIVEMYEAIGNYKPGDPSSDQGATELDAMRWMTKYSLDGIFLDAFADVDHTNIDAVKQAIALFGGVYIGVMITQADMDAFEHDEAWEDTEMRDIRGGHALWVPAYDVGTMDGPIVITWGRRQTCSWDWFKAKCDEAHACIFFPWMDNSVGSDPDGFNRAQLEADLKAL